MNKHNIQIRAMTIPADHQDLIHPNAKTDFENAHCHLCFLLYYMVLILGFHTKTKLGPQSLTLSR